ncbi:MAG: hypothetical protein ISS31_04740 [Kiritimatiellae bacterium]|nr:hypothetical protein [Kiritimatiellia bacterium]
MTKRKDNPEHAALERLIRTEIWPGIERIFKGTELHVDAASDDGRPPITIEPGPGPELRNEAGEPETAVSFLFLVTSDEEPWSEDGRAPCFCRFNITCTRRGYMVGTDFYIYFPAETDMNRLRPLLANSMFSGNPPSLRCESGHGDLPGVLVVGFSHGCGGEYYGELPVATMLADLAERINFLRRAIRAVHALNENFASDALLDRLVRELEKCFSAH